MPGNAPGAQINNLLADIGSQVGYALQITCKAYAVNIILYGCRAEHTGRTGMRAVFAAHHIYRIVALNDLVCQKNI